MFFRKNFLFLFLFFGVSAFPLWAQSAPPLRLSLDDCLRMAEEKNAKMTAADYDIEAAKFREIEAQARFKPVLEGYDRVAPVPRDARDALGSFFEGDVTLFNGTRITAVLPIYYFGKIGVAELLGENGSRAARERREKGKDEIHYDVKRLYYGLLLSGELKDLMQEALEKIESQLKKEEETQKHTPYEVAKLKVFKLELQSKRADALEKERLAQAALRIQLGLADDQSFALADQDLKPTAFSLKPLETYINAMPKEKSDFILVDIGIRAKELEWKLEQTKLYPNLNMASFIEVGRTTNSIRNLSATDDFNNPFNYTRAGIGLELRGTIDWHAGLARVRRIKNEYYKAKVEGSLAKEGMDLEVKEAYEDVARLQGHVKEAEEKKKLARQMVFLSKTNLDVGVGEEKDYTDALQLLLLTRGEYFKTVFDYNAAVAKLEWKAGGRL